MPTGRDSPTVLQKLLLVAFGLAVLVVATTVLEVVLRAVGAGDGHLYEDPFVGFAGGRELFVRATTPEGLEVYRTSPEKLAFFNEQQFPAEKGRNTFRIFALGGSTTAGRPYDAEFAFPAWLGRYLEASSSERKFEVVNAGGISYASYRVALLMRELVRYEPDLFVVYTGHNEFLEERTYSEIIHQNRLLKSIRRRLNGLRSYTLARHAVRQVRGGRELPSTLDADVATRLDTWRGLDLYHRDPELRTSIGAHFDYNLRQMAAIADAADVPLLFVKPISNLKDFSPFKSEFASDVDNADRRRVSRLLGAAREALESGMSDLACARVPEALAADRSYAASWFVHGRCLLAAGRFDEARSAFVSARDEDVAPLRAPSELLETIEAVTRDLDVPLIDLPGILERQSDERLGHTILGSEYLLDHVHPDIPVHGLLAERILEYLTVEEIIASSALPGPDRRRAIFASVVDSMDERYYARRDLNLAKVLGWAGKLVEAEEPLRRAARVLTNDPEVFLNLGIVLQRTGRLQEAALHLEKSLELDPDSPEAHFNLGVVESAAGRISAASRSFRRALELRPDYPEALYNLALVEQRMGNWEGAREALQRTLDLRGDSADIHRQLAITYRALDRPVEARRSLERAVDLEPRTGAALAEIGIELAGDGRYSAASDALELALELDSGNTEALFGVGLVHAATGAPDKAAASYRRVIEIDPGHSRALNNLGILVARRGDLEEAHRLLLQAVEAEPGYADGHFNLGVVLDASGELNLAISAVERALEIDAGNARYHQALALLLAAAGDQEGARRHRDRAVANETL